MDADIGDEVGDRSSFHLTSSARGEDGSCADEARESRQTPSGWKGELAPHQVSIAMQTQAMSSSAWAIDLGPAGPGEPT
jgi:hypothetical protein